MVILSVKWMKWKYSNNDSNIFKPKREMNLDNNYFNIIIKQTFHDERYNKITKYNHEKYIQIDEVYPSTNHTY